MHQKEYYNPSHNQEEEPTMSLQQNICTLRTNLQQEIYLVGDHNRCMNFIQR